MLSLLGGLEVVSLEDCRRVWLLLSLCSSASSGASSPEVTLSLDSSLRVEEVVEVAVPLDKRGEGKERGDNKGGSGIVIA